jgi:hypothetical protein
MKFSCVWRDFDLISPINSPMGWHPLKKEVPAFKNMLPVCKLGAGALINLHIILLLAFQATEMGSTTA